MRYANSCQHLMWNEGDAVDCVAYLLTSPSTSHAVAQKSVPLVQNHSSWTGFWHERSHSLCCLVLADGRTEDRAILTPRRTRTSGSAGGDSLGSFVQTFGSSPPSTAIPEPGLLPLLRAYSSSSIVKASQSIFSSYRSRSRCPSIGVGAITFSKLRSTTLET